MIDKQPFYPDMGGVTAVSGTDPPKGDGDVPQLAEVKPRAPGHKRGRHMALRR